jgi:hypothetical protein
MRGMIRLAQTWQPIPVIRNLCFILVICPTVAFGQRAAVVADSLRSVHAEYCAHLTTPDRSRMSAANYRTALWGLASCHEQGGRVLAVLWQRPPVDTADLTLLVATSSRNPNSDILTQVVRIVRDRGASESTRLAAAKVMASYAMPHFGGISFQQDTGASATPMVSVGFVDHPPSDRVLSGARTVVLRVFDEVHRSEPHSRVGIAVGEVANAIRAHTAL